MKRIRSIIGFNDTWLIAVGWPMVTFVIVTLLYGKVPDGAFIDHLTLKTPMVFLHTGIIWFTLRWIVSLYIKRYNENSTEIKQLVVYQAISIIVVYFILDFLLGYFLHAKLMGSTVPEPYTLFIMDISGVLMAFLLIALYNGAFFYNKLRKSELEKTRLEQANVQSQLEGLKNQVNPHFLFNSLNTLCSIIPENPDKSVRFVQKLSKVYRYILEIRDKKLIKLSEELEFLNAYIFLLRERWGDKVQIELNINDNLKEHYIIPLSLQILFENAIKHNIISKEKPLHIKVFNKKDDKIIVHNNLQRKNQVMNSTKMGLENIKKRYKFFTELTVDVMVTEETFIVSIPLIENKLDKQYAVSDH